MLSPQVMDTLRETITVGPGAVLHGRDGEPYGVVADGFCTILRIKHPDCAVDDLISEAAHYQRTRRGRNSRMDQREKLDPPRRKD